MKPQLLSQLRLSLITPHGDRKPATSMTPVMVSVSSLPLMGIVNEERIPSG